MLLPCFLALLRTCFGSAALIQHLVGNAQKTWSCRRSSRNSCQALQSFPVMTAKGASNHLLQLSVGSEGFAAISSRRSAFRKLGIALGSGDMRAQQSILGQVCPPQRSRSAAKYSASAVQGQRQPGHACHKMRPGKWLIPKCRKLQEVHLPVTATGLSRERSQSTTGAPLDSTISQHKS